MVTTATTIARPTRLHKKLVAIMDCDKANQDALATFPMTECNPAAYDPAKTPPSLKPHTVSIPQSNIGPRQITKMMRTTTTKISLNSIVFVLSSHMSLNSN